MWKSKDVFIFPLTMLEDLPTELLAIILAKAIRLDPFLCQYLFQICRAFEIACKHVKNVSLYSHWLDSNKDVSETVTNFVSKYGKITKVYFTRESITDYLILDKLIDCPIHIGISERSGVGPERLRLKRLS